jgi:hypothetical protein
MRAVDLERYRGLKLQLEATQADLAEIEQDSYVVPEEMKGITTRALFTFAWSALERHAGKTRDMNNQGKIVPKSKIYLGNSGSYAEWHVGFRLEDRESGIRVIHADLTRVSSVEQGVKKEDGFEEKEKYSTRWLDLTSHDCRLVNLIWSVQTYISPETIPGYMPEPDESQVTEANS